MIKKIKCQNCLQEFNVDFSKISGESIIVACPKCAKKYKLVKPASKNEVSPSNTAEVNSNKKTEGNINNQQEPKDANIKSITCPSCKKVLQVDLSKVPRFPAILQCKSCAKKFQINNPDIKKDLTQNKQLQEIPIKIDKTEIDPKNNWAYKLYYYTRKITYVNKVTLLIFLGYLVKSISKTVSSIGSGKINPESFLKIIADANVLTSKVFNYSINPILTELDISPRLVAWASSWFLKKLSLQIILKILRSRNADLTQPFIKQYLEKQKKQDHAKLNFFTSPAMKFIYMAVLLISPIFIDTISIVEIILAILFPVLLILLAKNMLLVNTKNLFIGYLYFNLFLIPLISTYSETALFSQDLFQIIIILLTMLAIISDSIYLKNKFFKLISNVFKPVFVLFTGITLVILKSPNITSFDWKTVYLIIAFFSILGFVIRDLSKHILLKKKTNKNEKASLTQQINSSTEHSKKKSKYRPLLIWGVVISLTLATVTVVLVIFVPGEPQKYNTDLTLTQRSVFSTAKTVYVNTQTDMRIGDTVAANKNRVYFYLQADHNTKSNSFFVNGQKAVVTEDIEGDFVKVSFEYNNIITNGYILKSELTLKSERGN